MTRLTRLVSLAALTCGLALAPSMTGCSSAEEAGPDCTTGTQQAYVLTSLQFTREETRGVVPGFDLDDKVTLAPEDRSCGKVDLVDPAGQKGIDNQLAIFLPEIEKQFGNAIDGIVQGAINDGRLLVLLDVNNVDDPMSDACVNMDVKLAEGKPALGTDGVLEAYQTFDLRKVGQKVSVAKKGRFDKNTFTIGPFDLYLPIAIFDVAFVIHLRDARMKFTLDEEGNASGLLGGGVSIDEVADGVKDGAGLADVIPQIRTLGKLASDLGFDENEGVCKLMSASFLFKARPAFVRK